MASNDFQKFLLPAALLLLAAAMFALRPYIFGRSKPALDPDNFQEFPLVEKTQVTHNTAIYRFKLPREDSILGLPIGQHISVAAKLDGQEKDVVRSYTPVSSDDDKGYFDLMIKSYPTGNVSKYIGQMKIGDTIKVKGPKGQMKYDPNIARHLGMIAGGSGITPMLQISKAIIKGRPRNGGNDETEVDLIFANVNPEDILLKEQLDSLAKEDDKFRVHYVLDNPPENWDGGKGYITPDMMKDKFPGPAKDTKVLICGPPPMVSALKKAVVDVGYDKPAPVSKVDHQVFCF